MARRDDVGVELYSNGNYWQAVWIDSAGKRRKRSLGSKAKVSRRDAKRECRKIAADHAVNPAKRDVANAPPLRRWCDQFLELRPDFSESTRKLYDQTIEYLTQHFGDTPRVHEIGRKEAATFSAWLRRKDLSEATVRKHIRNCKVVFGAAVDNDLLALNPFDRQSGSTPNVDADWRYVTADELASMLEAAHDSRWQAFIALLRLAGLRLDEARRLQWSDVDWQRRTIAVRHEGEQTTKKRRRTVPMQPRLHQIMLDRFADAKPGETPAPVPGDTSNVHRELRVIIKRAGLEPWAKPCHTLRKNLESDWLAEYPVMDVCRWLGHAPTVAAQHYHQTTSDTMRQVTGDDGPAEADQLRDEIAMLRRRLRRVIGVTKRERASR